MAKITKTSVAAKVAIEGSIKRNKSGSATPYAIPIADVKFAPGMERVASIREWKVGFASWLRNTDPKPNMPANLVGEELGKWIAKRAATWTYGAANMEPVDIGLTKEEKGSLSAEVLAKMRAIGIAV